jgi:hypothetical protein
VNLETVSAITQLVAAIGVIASLFYLAAQIRQNTRSQRSVVVDSLTTAGFREYLEATEPIAEAVPLTELIRGKP